MDKEIKINYRNIKRFSMLFLALNLSCSTGIEDPYDFYFNTPQLGETARNIEILYSDSTYVQVKITGPTLLRIAEGGLMREEFPDGIEVEFLDRNGHPTSWLSAKRAIRQPVEKIVIFRDSVYMYNTQKEALRSSELIWNEKDGSIHTTKYVEISRPGEIIQGFGLKTNEDLSEYEINAVTGRIKSGDLDADFQ